MALRIPAVSAILVAIFGGIGCSQVTPAELLSNPCLRAAQIDGRQTQGEWDAAACHALSMSMIAVDSAKDPRDAQLFAMNSASNLYVALRVPDPDPEASLEPMLSDLALLVFAAGEQVAAGDDRKLIIPGAYIDKHVVEPGKDADDAVQHGSGAMGHADGEYFAEWSLPLNSGDGEDLAAKPGDRVRFNLVYADGFTADLKGTEFGGIFTPSGDDASGWGTLLLADDVGAEEPAAEPEWLTRLFPHTGEPDDYEHRLRRVEATQIPVGNQMGGQVTCELVFRGIDGKPLTARARIFLPPEVLSDPAAKVPLWCNTGYELNAGGASGRLAKGWAVSTPHAHPQNPLDRGPNLDIALLHAVRALPFIDSSRVMIQGGSAGGYTALMVAAETFPVVCVMPAVPPVNWGYNAEYFFRNSRLARAVPEGSQTPTLPVLSAVIGIAEAGRNSMGPDTDADSWLMSSPISHLQTLTAPIQVTFSTADMLVPIDQVSAELIQPRENGLLPEGFTTAIDELITRPEARHTLLELLPKEAYEQFIVPVPEGAPVAKPGAAAGPPAPIQIPFSPERIWSIVVINEGPVEPDVGHFRYALAPSQEAFIQWAFERGVTKQQLTLEKLKRLMMRLRGVEYRPFTTQLEGGDEPIQANRLDFPRAERADVLTGLKAFAQEDERALWLAGVYEGLPAELKALGPRLAGNAEQVRQALHNAN